LEYHTFVIPLKDKTQIKDRNNPMYHSNSPISNSPDTKRDKDIYFCFAQE